MSAGSQRGGPPGTAGTGSERDRLRERLHQVEINAGRIDAQYGGSFREEIGRVRDKLEEAERALERTGDDGGGGEVWTSLDAEIRALEDRTLR